MKDLDRIFARLISRKRGLRLSFTERFFILDEKFIPVEAPEVVFADLGIRKAAITAIMSRNCIYPAAIIG